MFLELPRRKDYPDYYQATRVPISLAEIEHKLNTSSQLDYSLLELKSDLNLMVANAQSYNRHNSPIYKDAATIAKFVEKNLSTQSSSEAQPPPPQRITIKIKEPTAPVLSEKDIEMMRVYSALIKLKKDGRLLTELFQDMPDRDEYPEYYEIIHAPIALSVIHDKITGNKYTSMDDMERDIIQMTDNAKKFNVPDSEVHLDAIEILAQFYKISGRKPEDSPFNQPMEEFIYHKQRFTVGDFVLISSKKKDEDEESDGEDEIVNVGGVQPTVGVIHRIWKNLGGKSTFSANLFLRPDQTMHPETRKFYKNEVFKSDIFSEHISSETAGRCLVMFIKDYVRGRPYGLDKSIPVFVCESRYAGKRMSPIKLWKQCLPDTDEEEPPLVPFDKLTQLERVDSPFFTVKPVKEPSSKAIEPDDEASDEDEMEIDEDTDDADASDDGNDSDRPKKRGRPPVEKPVKSEKRNTSVKPQSASTMKPRSASQMRNAMLQQQQILAQQQQQFVPKPPTETLPDETVQQFPHKDGKIIWTNAPPVLVMRKSRPVHSIEYLQFKARQAQVALKGKRAASKSPERSRHVTTPEVHQVVQSHDSVMNSIHEALNDAASVFQKDAKLLHQHLLSLSSGR